MKKFCKGFPSLESILPVWRGECKENQEMLEKTSAALSPQKRSNFPHVCTNICVALFLDVSTVCHDPQTGV